MFLLPIQVVHRPRLLAWLIHQKLDRSADRLQLRPDRDGALSTTVR
jgi:hypothetical protein